MMHKLVLVGKSTFAQLSIGVKIGPTLAKIAGTDDGLFDDEFAEARFAFHIGAFMNIRPTEKISFPPELLYSSKGFHDGDGSEANIHLNYLAIPIMFRYHLFSKLELEVGPEIGLKLSAKSKTGNQNIDLGDLFNKDFDLGIDAGFIFDVTESIHLGLRYNYGLTSIINIQITDDQGNSLGEVNFKNRVVYLSIGYKIIK